MLVIYWFSLDSQKLTASKKFQMTHFTMLNNIFSMKFALKLVPGLADVGVPHGDGDGPRTPPRCLDGANKSFK